MKNPAAGGSHYQVKHGLKRYVLYEIFEIIKKHEALTSNPPGKIYFN